MAGHRKSHGVRQRCVRERQVVLPLGLRQVPALGGCVRGHHAGLSLEGGCCVGINQAERSDIAARDAEIPRLNHLRHCSCVTLLNRLACRMLSMTHRSEVMSWLSSLHLQQSSDISLDACELMAYFHFQKALPAREAVQVASAAGGPEASQGAAVKGALGHHSK